VEIGAPRLIDDARRIAVIGGGWAGCAAALRLAELGHPVALFESATVLGGRARRIVRSGLALDNGQHLLLGAYRQTLDVVARAADAAHLANAFTRRPLTLVPFAPAQAGALAIRGRNAPGQLGLLLALLCASGLSWRERLANLRWMHALRRADFRRPAHETVARMLAPLPPRVAQLLWEPLCLAALNTPAADASARVFANVLRATFAGTPDDSDFLLNAIDLTDIFPAAVARRLQARGDLLATGTRATIVQSDGSGAVLEARGMAVRARAVVVAVGPHQLASAFAPEILARQPALEHALSALASLTYEPITTIWLGYGGAVRVDAPILRLDDAPGQWVVDRPDILAGAQIDPQRPTIAQLLAVIISAGGPHLVLPHAELAEAVAAQLRRLRPDMPPVVWTQVVVERRATYACTPKRVRPAGPRASPGVYLAGDYVDPDFPATIEAAVRSGLAAADAIDADLGAGR
jgi:squalene-associated FAD-dependent desaturase